MIKNQDLRNGGCGKEFKCEGKLPCRFGSEIRVFRIDFIDGEDEEGERS